ncbi:MAG: hypothetical protein PHY34_00170 [Patescibacteria group bacterium]|nr:hypothetical protein [Patescibacteria group bacterium]MDD5715953.1 hypothetical protein [Patescibacteria group bacterium]
MGHGLKQLIQSISKREWIFIAVIACATIVITAAPYLYGYFTRPTGMVYTGLHHLTPGDTNVFLSMIEQVKQGHAVFLNLYTGEAQSRIFINPLWLSVGLFAKAFDMPNLLALHIARSILIAVFIFVVYLFIAYVIRHQRWRVWVLILIVFSSGLGVFFNPFLFDPNNIEEHPTDIWVPESITFLTLYHTPHIIASLTLIVLVFLLMLLAFDTNRVSYSVAAGIANLFLTWFHPFNAPTIALTLAIFICVQCIRSRTVLWQYLKHGVVLALFTVPPVLYLYLISRADWVIRNWSAQNILNSPSIWMYLIGFGLLLPLAAVGAWKLRGKPTSRHIFVLSWIAATMALVYFPVAFQRRMIEGFHIPLSILAFIGVASVVSVISRKRGSDSMAPVIVLIVLFVFLPLTNAQIVGQDIHLYQTKKALPYYLTEQEVEAMHWLRDHVGEREVIFSSYYMGNFIPAYSGRVVWVGHGPQTINLQEKFTASEWFWQDDTDSTGKKQFLNEQNIAYVFYGQKEKESGSYDPDTKAYLEAIFRNRDVSIYRVRE